MGLRRGGGFWRDAIGWWWLSYWGSWWLWCRSGFAKVQIWTLPRCWTADPWLKAFVVAFDSDRPAIDRCWIRLGVRK
jgi:hypothetical protein